jgi:hypothetical protein
MQKGTQRVPFFHGVFHGATAAGVPPPKGSGISFVRAAMPAIARMPVADEGND